DGHDQDAARGNGAVHRLFGETVLAAPGAAVQIEHRRERPWALWLIDAGHQLPPGRRAPELHLADLELEFGRRIVGHLRSRPFWPRAGVPEAKPRASDHAGGADCSGLLQKTAAIGAVSVHAALLACAEPLVEGSIGATSQAGRSFHCSCGTVRLDERWC